MILALAILLAFLCGVAFTAAVVAVGAAGAAVQANQSASRREAPSK